VNGDERVALEARSPKSGRPEATRDALIPVKKSEGWWNFAQEVRRESARSHRDRLPLPPGGRRRLHHRRDLGESFDFLTWFEYAPEHAGAFEELVGRLGEA